MRDLKYMHQGELAQMQRCRDARKYYWGYIGWLPAIGAFVGAILVFMPGLSTIASFIVAISAGLGLLFLQKPLSDASTQLLKNMGIERPSPLESILFPIKYKFWLWKRSHSHEQ